jgi:hypothetical protein
MDKLTKKQKKEEEELEAFVESLKKVLEAITKLENKLAPKKRKK